MSDDDKALCERLRKDSCEGSVMDQAADRIEALAAENARLREAITGALDDMGRSGLSVSALAKAELRVALGDAVRAIELDYQLRDALRVVIECDEMHGKRSPLRAALEGKNDG